MQPVTETPTPRRARARILIAVAAVVAAVAVVGGAYALGRSGGAPDTSPSPAAASPSAGKATPSEPTADVVLALGDSRESSGGEVVSTVYGYRQPVAKSAPRPDGQPGFEWGALDVKVCVKGDYVGDPIVVGNARWLLVYDDDTQIGPTDTGYEAHPKPEYPWEKELAPGRCVRGWITYPVPAAERPVFVEYAASSERVPPRWAVD